MNNHESLMKERIIVEAMMAADRLGEGNLIAYLNELYEDTGESFSKAVVMFMKDNVGQGEAFSGKDYEGLNWGRILGDLYTFYLPGLLFEEERLEIDNEISNDISERIRGLHPNYRLH